MLRIIKSIFKKPRQREYLTEEYSSGHGYLRWFIKFIVGLLAVFAVLFLLILSDALYANEQPFNQVSMQSVSEGSLLIKTNTPGMYQQIPLLHTDVVMHVSGMILRSHVKQSFKNTGNEWVEAIYVFPLPEQAAVDHMRMYLNDRIIEGMIEEKQEAKRIYEQAKREGKKAALIEQERPNLFTNSVANIGPGESIIIEIEYQQVLKYDHGRFSLRFPMAITPRYIPGEPITESIHLDGGGWSSNTDQVSDASRITPPVYEGQDKINPISLRIELDAGLPLEDIKSSYHAITQKDLGANKKEIALKEVVVASDRDFELIWQPKVGHEPRAAIFNQKIKDEHYQLLMVMPPNQKATNPQALPREVIYVIDTSGSMSGVSMDQAKRSLLMALERLRPTDRFNIIQFNSVTDQLFNKVNMASVANVQQARRYVQQLQADGGTEMAPALRAALNNQTENQYVRQVVFITDGSVGNEKALFDIINHQLGQTRLFTVGIGSAPNSYFMRKAAQFGRGTFTYISDVSEVKEKMTELFNKLENPVMTNIGLEYPGDAEIWPIRIPDLYEGEPVIVAVKTSYPAHQVEIKGMRQSAPWQATLDVQQGKPAAGIGTFWARSKISALMDSLHEGADKNSVREQVVKVALDHHLVSQYTSLVAVDVTPTRPQSENLNSHNVPVNLPHGQNFQKIFGRLPQTATSAELNMISGLILLFVAWLSMRYRFFVKHQY
ncbi:MAG TPA: marine proteobacterial sortase target protein [Gammaproteobacteria bacterium]